MIDETLILEMFPDLHFVFPPVFCAVGGMVWCIWLLFLLLWNDHSRMWINAQRQHPHNWSPLSPIVSALHNGFALSGLSMHEVTFVRRITAHSVSGVTVYRRGEAIRAEFLFFGKLTCRHTIVDVHGYFNVNDIDHIHKWWWWVWGRVQRVRSLQELWWKR